MRDRLLLVLSMAVIVGVSYFGVFVPLSQWRSSTLSELVSVQNERVQLSQSITRLKAEKQSFVSDDLTGLTWVGAQTGEATAKVQSAVNDTARSNGILMRSIAPTNVQNADISNAITFRLEFEASLDQLVPFLKTIEFGQPALVVTRANMRRLSRPNDTGPQPDLFVQIDLAAPVTLNDGSQG